jgi:hypothetical protein
MAREKRERLPDGSYEVGAIQLDKLKSGAPYCSVDCLACGKLVPLFAQPENALRQEKFEGPGHLLVACQHCGASRLYDSKSLKIVPWP